MATSDRGLNKTAELSGSPSRARRGATGRDAAEPAVQAGSAERKIGGVGRIFFWQGGSLWIGRQVSQTQAHAHHAIQMSFALGDGDAHLRIRHGDPDAWHDYRAAVILSHCRHAFDARGGAVAQIFVEPETGWGRGLTAAYGAAEVSALRGISGEAVAVFRRALEDRQYDAGPLVDAARGLTASLAGVVQTPLQASPRLEAMLAFAAQHQQRRLTLGDLARAVHLSPSRARHVFASGTGTTFRGYMLWLRINRAVSLMMEGRSWTDAAHGAGFADSAHLSRTFRRVFGLSPAMLVRD